VTLRDSSSDKMPSISRRDALLYGLTAAAAGLAAGQAHAQFAAVEWEQRFDAGGMPQLRRSHVPILSQQTLAATEAALQEYTGIEGRGGWPLIPPGPMLKLGSRHPNVEILRQRLAASGDLQATAVGSTTFDSYVEAAVRRFQTRHGLLPSGSVTEATFTALNVPARARRAQLEINAGRLRSLQNPGDRFVMVNIPAASIEAVEGGQVALSHTAVVGKPDRASPLLNVKATEVNFNPFWTVPASIVRKDLIPKMQANPEYLTKNHIRIYDQRGNELQSTQVNWNSNEATNYMFRADPGEVNPLGSVRINIPNKDGVYMHDTPEKGLFGGDERYDSSGCVRVQNVRELVEWLLRRNPGWDRGHIDAAIRSGDRIDVRLAQPVTVHWVYISAWGDPDGTAQFREDIYGRDGLEVAYR